MSRSTVYAPHAPTHPGIASPQRRAVRRVLGLAVAPLLLMAAGLSASGSNAHADDDYWLHIRVQESHEDGDLVRVNLPLRLVESMLPMIESDDFSRGKIRIDDHDLDYEDLRAIWDAVRESPDGEFVTIESRDESVRVAKEKGKLLVNIHDKGWKEEQVEVTVPLSVVDALLSGRKDEIDLMAGLAALQREGEGVYVNVNGTEETVRIWVDKDQDSNP